MNLSEFLNGQEDYFVALQYHTLLMNRRLLVIVDNVGLVVLKMGNMLADHHPTDSSVNLILKDMQVAQDRRTALNYIEQDILQMYDGLNYDDIEALAIASINVRIAFKDIRRVEVNRKRKWGMGTVPYTGRIILSTAKRKHEFIVLGDQDINMIYKKITCAEH